MVTGGNSNLMFSIFSAKYMKKICYLFNLFLLIFLVYQIKVTSDTAFFTNLLASRKDSSTNLNDKSFEKLEDESHLLSYRRIASHLEGSKERKLSKEGIPEDEDKLSRKDKNNVETTNLESNVTAEQLNKCPSLDPNKGGRVKLVLDDVPSLEEQERLHEELFDGGTFRPSGCEAVHKVAIIVPFRDRFNQLLIFLYNMNPFLQKQLIEYRIFLVEQSGNDPFNRAMLLNIGFKVAQKIQNYTCYIFHDVDALPEDERNLYRCYDKPLHLASAMSRRGYRLHYPTFFGGANAMTAEQFMKVNGFSNEYWGWGAEDDDMWKRIKYFHLDVMRYPQDVARYLMLPHEQTQVNPLRGAKLKKSHLRYLKDGLSNLRYELVDYQPTKLYTLITVELPYKAPGEDSSS